MKPVALFTVLALFTAGCTGVEVKEGDRQLSDQNQKWAEKGLAALVGGPTGIPVAVEAFKEIRLNSGQQLKVWGLPQKSEAASPEASARARGQQEKDHSDPWWLKALFVAGGLITGIGGTLLKTHPAGAALVAVIEGITKARETIQAKPDLEQLITEGDLLQILKETQEKAGVQKYVAQLASKVEAQRAPLL